MDEKNPLSRIEALISRLEAMAENRQRLVEENRKLREQHEQWLQERAFLISRNEQAKNRVEAMIARLKVLEEHT
ncbi:TIGR02449 family protein [Lysobacteraceae bacterium NML75-0749]|nr:TIGR02449 family protein [Xanthomonadaceae bacterium NML75-0749]PJK04404.1 TIGR02449 family protein [Xanthomonadaceae bacterium NML91-0268]PJK06841.1 TIGR02449 family protein [Xanthomonadaceae bacterium NML71-0210]